MASPTSWQFYKEVKTKILWVNICAQDLELLRSIGIMGVLIGETFMRETDIEQSFKKLFN